MQSLSSVVVTDIGSLFTVDSPRGRQVVVTDRPAYGLSFCIDGQITYSHRGRRFVSDRNHAILLPQGQTYSLYGDKKGAFPVINFTCAEPLSETVVVLPIRAASLYLAEFERMKTLAIFPENRAKLFSIFYNLLDMLAADAAPQHAILSEALRYISDNISDPLLCNTAVAAHCGISEVYFRKLFHAGYRRTPKQFILEVRLNKAKQCLTDGILSVSGTAEVCGFSSPYHFCRMFKEKVGVTPSEYLRQNKVCRL